MKPKLYQYTACPFCSKVAAFLNYKGVDYEAVEVHPLNKKEIAFSGEYKKVPIYVNTEGVQFNESTDIMKHIDETSAGDKVFQNTEEEKKWLDWSEDYVQGLPTVIYDKFGNSLQAFNYITKVGNFNWFQKRMIKWSGAVIMTLVSKKIAEKRNISSPIDFLKSKVQEWADGLNGKDFNGGSKPNAADIAVYGISRIVSQLKAGEFFKENQIFHAWMKRMETTTKLSTSIY